jgi:hypothetical protein
MATTQNPVISTEGAQRRSGETCISDHNNSVLATTPNPVISTEGAQRRSGETCI